MPTKTCVECKKPFKIADNEFAKWVRYCRTCSDGLENQQREDAERELRQRRWREFKVICPPAYVTIDKIKLPAPAKLDEVMEWQYGLSGLLLHGDTGMGKSRCAWALLAREKMAGRSIAAIDSMSGLRYAAIYSQSPENLYDWIESLIETQILLADDLFKSKLTDSWESTVFTILDQRAQQLKPTIITCNDTGVTLASRMSDDRGAPLLRRLRENCTAICFKLP